MLKSFGILLFVFFTTIPTDAEETALIPDQYLDVRLGKLVTGKAIIIVDNRIAAVVPVGDVESTTKIIRLEGLTLLPGLIDAHSHILLHPYNETSWTDQVLKESRAERILRAENHLKATLLAGFTSLRDLGSEGAGYADVGIRDSLNIGVIIGPRLIVAGRAIVATGSYGPKGFDLSHQINLGAEPADGPDLIRVVRDQIGKGADIVKVYGDYRWGPDGSAKPTFSIDELKLIVTTANSSGRPVVAHASTDEAMRRAVLAGVQSIEHGDDGTLDTFKLMAENGVVLCPTIAAGDAISMYQGWDKTGDTIPERIITKRRSMELAIKAGVTICNGSDVGVFSHGKNARELYFLVDHGLTPNQAIYAATITGAKLMGHENDLGEIKIGYLADLVAVKGNPLLDIATLGTIKFVMKNGIIYKN